MSETDFLEQDIADSAPNEEVVVQDNLEQTTENYFPTWDDVKEGRVNYKELPGSIKNKVKQEAYDETPEDKKYLWDDYGYTPPQTYNGVDRNGKPVKGFGLEGFEELVNKGRIKPKTKIEQDVENLTHIVTEQAKSSLSQRELEIERKISEARENVDFETYEKLREERESVKFQKLQLDNKKPQISDIPQVPQFSLDEQVAIKKFADNHKDFVSLMQKSKDVETYFDQTALELYQKNQNATPEQILAATKSLTENRFNLNKQQKPMFRNTIRPEEKTNIVSKPAPRLNYNSLSERDKKLINSEAKSGRAKYSGKSMDDITNMVYGEVFKNMLKK